MCLIIDYPPTSATVDGDGADRVVYPEPEQQLVRGEEHGPGQQPHLYSTVQCTVYSASSPTTSAAQPG